MPQLLFKGFPDGAIRIGTTVSVLKKDGAVTYFVGPDNYFSHRESDGNAQRFAIATLIANGHARASEVERSSLRLAHRTLMNWTRQLEMLGPDSFFTPRRVRGQTVITAQKAAECGRLLNEGATIASAARQANVGDSALRKAVKAGRVVRGSLPADERPCQLRPLGKMLTDTVKMIAYRAETALVMLVRPHLTKEEEARALIRELLVSSADLEPNDEANTLTVRIHRMTCPSHITAIRLRRPPVDVDGYQSGQRRAESDHQPLSSPSKSANHIPARTGSLRLVMRHFFGNAV